MRKPLTLYEEEVKFQGYHFWVVYSIDDYDGSADIFEIYLYESKQELWSILSPQFINELTNYLSE